MIVGGGSSNVEEWDCCRLCRKRNKDCPLKNRVSDLEGLVVVVMKCPNEER